MTWTVPTPPTPPDGPLLGSERPLLDDFLMAQRWTLQNICAGLDGEQLTLRATPPATLSLLGLIRHMAAVERVWFRERLAGMVFDPMYPGRRDADFDDTDPAAAATDFARFQAEIAAADQVAAHRSLDDQFEHRGEVFSLRWVYLHMIEEYARHNGHADLLRQAIDGETGR